MIPRLPSYGKTLELVLSVVCGLRKYRILARFQMADDIRLYKDGDDTGQLPSIKQNSPINKLPIVHVKIISLQILPSRYLLSSLCF